jgi:hypothetical protein
VRGDLGIGQSKRNRAIPGIGKDAIMLRAGVSREDAKSQSLLARVGSPGNHANVANPRCDKAIQSPRFHNSVALLSTFNFLPTNPG